ncbi:hypothetical protein CH249_12520 [Rhodococcus sp. 05-2255-3B1]|nr:hypothetical protein CH250_21150 [Rhodococcus sp. 05-2255-3C]OZE10601.1 hypothetical protein CH249_12520 [Rhodococcus sp. 05-2255-3B1]OZE20676.1 hypothetical protein CH255_08690 [Rhodococcus sp. 05-2255-2A2]
MQQMSSEAGLSDRPECEFRVEIGTRQSECWPRRGIRKNRHRPGKDVVVPNSGNQHQTHGSTIPAEQPELPYAWLGSASDLPGAAALKWD